MNYYARLYTDDYIPDDIKVHISVIEVYETTIQQKAKIMCDVNITDNTVCKYVKKPYSIINVGNNTVTLNKRSYNMNTHDITYAEIYTILSQLLEEHGYIQERIEHISLAIHNITNNSSIKSNRNCYGDWIGF